MRLTEKNIRKYLEAKKLVNPHSRLVIKRLIGGWVNPLFLIQTEKKSFVVKQILAHGKEGGDFENFHFPEERMFNEYNALKISSQYLPEYVPHLIKGDLKHKVIIMEYIADAGILVELAQKKKIRAKTIKSVADFLVKLHNRTLGRRELEKKVSHKSYWPLKYEYQYLRVKCSKKAKKKIRKFVEIFSKRKYCLVHGDMNAKNILIAKNHSIKIIDWEECGYSDPCHDVGVILAELILFHHWNNHIKKRHIKYLFNNYVKKSRFKNKEALKKSIMVHCSSVILARLNGPIRYKFLPSKIKPKLKDLAEMAILKEATDTRHFL
jgi:5-methylthioribose kinase